ncbi:MAG: hypothetical protein MUC49_16860 [Raineya sp.]|jgi:hypothetical protein|nr:hypothetical protein [Raineya sp.]
MKKFTHLIFAGILSLSPLSFISAQTAQQPVESGNFETLEQVNIKRTGFLKRKFTVGNFHTTKVGIITKTDMYFGIFTRFQSYIKTRFKFEMANEKSEQAQTRCFITTRMQRLPVTLRIPLAVVIEDAFGGEINLQNQEKWSFEIFNLRSINRNPIAGYAYLEDNPEEKVMIEPIMTPLPIMKKLIQLPAGLSFYYKGELIGKLESLFNKEKIYYKKNTPENIKMLMANLSVAYMRFQDTDVE